MADSDPIIRPKELKAVGFCYSGQLRWLKAAGLDAKAHFKEGTLESVLSATGDGFALRAIELTRARRNG